MVTLLLSISFIVTLLCMNISHGYLTVELESFLDYLSIITFLQQFDEFNEFIEFNEDF